MGVLFLKLPIKFTLGHWIFWIFKNIFTKLWCENSSLDYSKFYNFRKPIILLHYIDSSKLILWFQLESCCIIYWTHFEFLISVWGLPRGLWFVRKQIWEVMWLLETVPLSTRKSEYLVTEVPSLSGRVAWLKNRLWSSTGKWIYALQYIFYYLG